MSNLNTLETVDKVRQLKELFRQEVYYKDDSLHTLNLAIFEIAIDLFIENIRSNYVESVHAARNQLSGIMKFNIQKRFHDEFKQEIDTIFPPPENI